MDNSELSMQEWVKTVPQKVREDPLWKADYYRLSAYLYDLAWKDCELIRRDFRGQDIVHQLIRSSGGICANLEEAFGRGVGTKDYIRIIRIALGEARETIGWYNRARHILSENTVNNRIQLGTWIIAKIARVLSGHRQNLENLQSTEK